MKMLKYIILALLVIAALLLAVYAYYGGFSEIQFRKVTRDAETLVYEEMKGDYSQCGPVMDRVYYSLLNDYKVQTYKGFGLYYDNPKEVAKENLRSDIGCLLEKTDTAKIASIAQKFKVKTYEGGDFIETQFPNKGMVSVLVGVMRVYPALDAYMKESGYVSKDAIMEIYDTPNKTITYRVRISSSPAK